MLMTIHDYETQGGKNLIKEYLSSLPMDECRAGYHIRHEIILYGIEALEKLTRRQLRGKLWEIKFSDNRIMYVLADQENIYFLHACQKQKGKAEKFELETAIKRAKEAGFDI
jgi:phage-related protein